MATYYLCSGFGPEHSFVNTFGELLAGDLITRKSLVVISCGGDKEETEAHVGFVTQQLEEVGIVFECKMILSEEMSREEQRRYIKDADLIYLMGGYPFFSESVFGGQRIACMFAGVFRSRAGHQRRRDEYVQVYYYGDGWRE